jgi:hypothetical protein
MNAGAPFPLPLCAPLIYFQVGIGGITMAIILVSYDLKQPGRNYQPLYDYLKTFAWCKGLESVWLLDTTVSPASIRDHLNTLVHDNDKTFVVQVTRNWASHSYFCADWLNSSDRYW